MNEVSIAFAKLAGVRKVLQAVLDNREGARRDRPVGNFSPREVGQYFAGAVQQVQILRDQLPALFSDFPEIQHEPTLQMMEGALEPTRYRREQLEALARAIDQVFETRAHSELASPKVSASEPRVFISHGRANDWREVQAYIERDFGIRTLELAQEPNLGRTVLQKLEQESLRCTSAVIVMTGDDSDAEGNARARENVLHEIGYLQAKFGLSAVCLLHEEGTSIPSNIHGLVYIPFPKNHVSAAFGPLTRELKSFYRFT